VWHRWFLEVNPSKKSLQKLTLMNDSVIHRGPDAEGYFFLENNQPLYFINPLRELFLNRISESNIFLCHRRLSIIDLNERSHQPYTKHGFTIVFNGEIYNYIEIREELIELGIIFDTSSDTEVILSAYYMYGSNCVKKFNGMWAFSIFEHSTKILFLSRDRFGIKPLVYYYDEERLVFGSEIKQLLSFGIEPIANLSVLNDFLINDLSHHTEDSFFKNIKYLSPSHNMIVTIIENKISVNKEVYFNLDFSKNGLGLDELAINVSSTMEDAVKIRLRSDVNVGSCLSGGLDSSTIVTLAAKIQGVNGRFVNQHDFETFTSKYNDPKIDETYYSNLINEATNSNSNQTSFSVDELIHDIDSLIYYQEEPFDSFSIYGGYRVMKLASSKRMKVLLDGQGGDEIFLGYEIYYVEFLWSLIKGLRFKKILKLFSEIKHKSKLSAKKLLIYLIYFKLSWIRRIIKEKTRKKILNKTFYKRNKKNTNSIQNPSSNYVTWTSTEDLFKRNLYHRIQHLLHYEDRNSMAFSIETRLPFLDYRLVNLITSSNIEQLFNDNWLKGLLRKAMENEMPAEIIFRRNKFGFPAPEKELLGGLTDKYGIDDLLSNEEVKALFNIDVIRKIYDRNKNLTIQLKFYLVSMWIKKFNVKIFQD